MAWVPLVEGYFGLWVPADRSNQSCFAEFYGDRQPHNDEDFELIKAFTQELNIRENFKGFVCQLWFCVVWLQHIRIVF